MKQNYTLQQAMELDGYLFQLAIYDVSNGSMRIKHFKNIEDAMKMQDEVNKRFRKFKVMIQRGEANINEIEEMVIDRYGPFKIKNKFDVTLEEALDEFSKPNFVEDFIKEEEEIEIAKEFQQNQIKNIANIFENLSKSNFCENLNPDNVRIIDDSEIPEIPEIPEDEQDEENPEDEDIPKPLDDIDENDDEISE